MSLRTTAIKSVGSALKSIKSKAVKPSPQIVNKPNEMRFTRYLKGTEGKLPFTVEGNILRVDGKHFKLIPTPELTAINVAAKKILVETKYVNPIEQLIGVLHEVGHVKDPYLNYFLKDPRQILRQELRAWKWTSRIVVKTGWINNPAIRATLVKERRSALVSYERDIELGAWAKDNLKAAMRRAHVARLARFKYATEGVKL